MPPTHSTPIDPLSGPKLSLSGKVVTMDASKPQAQAVAITGDKITAVGSNADIQAYVGPNTKVIDLQGHLAIPGFNESHGHFMGLGQGLTQLKLMGVPAWQDIAQMVGDAAKQAKPGTWIQGRGWHQEKWNRSPGRIVKGFQTNDLINQAAPNNPVVLGHASGHALIANAKALELAGIGPNTPNPPGGEIIKDVGGKPTGVLVDGAQGLLRRALAKSLADRTPQEQQADFRNQVHLAVQNSLENGVTEFQDMGESFATIDAIKQMADEGDMPLRLYILVSTGEVRPDNVAALTAHRMIDYGKGHLTVRAIKAYVDGALGSRGAWLLEPYADLPTSTGLNERTPEQLAQTARLAMQNDYQLCIHAIGDRGNREVLNVYEAAFKAYPDKKDVRWRVEHAQHLSAADIPRFGRLGVIAAMQGIHCTSDAPYVLARLGPARAEEGAYVWQKLMKSGAVIANGTDGPVEDVDPLPGYYALVTRRQKNGEVFYGDQRMSRDEALKAYTANGAYAAFEEALKGQLVPGKLADITVLSADITKVPEDAIQKARVEYTIVGGKIRYPFPRE